MKKRGTLVVLVAVGLCVVAAATIFAVLRNKHLTLTDKSFMGEPPAGTVNGEPFFQEDLNVYATELRAVVAADYGRRYNLFGIGAKFWDTKYDGVTPRETLNKLALKDLVRNMVLIQEARRRGIDTPSSYHELEAERTVWNTPSNEIVYGPKQLGPAEYTSYRITAITDELKTVLLKKELAPTEAQLRTAFNSLPAEMKQAPYAVSGILFKWDSESSAMDEAIRAALKRALWQGFSPETAADSLAAEFPSLAHEDFAIDSRYISKEDNYQQELIQDFKDAVQGDIIPGPQERPELYYINKKDGGGIFTFEEAPGLGRNKWINDQFELLLDKKVKKARVKIY